MNKQELKIAGICTFSSSFLDRNNLWDTCIKNITGDYHNVMSWIRDQSNNKYENNNLIFRKCGNREEHYTYDAEGRVLTYNSNYGYWCKHSYSKDYECKIDSYGETLHKYFEGGKIVMLKSTNRVENYTYDDRGNLLNITDAEGKVLKSLVYDESNRLINENGTKYEYDDRGNKTKLSYKDRERSFVYCPKGNLIEIYTNTGYRECFSYDDYGNRIKDNSGTWEFRHKNGILTQVFSDVISILKVENNDQ